MVKKRISMNGQITIPRTIQRLLDINDGDYLCIYYNTNKEIIIDTIQNDNQLNLCIYRYGKVSIPSEIRRFMNIDLGSYLDMEISKDKRKVHLSKSNF